MRKLVGLTCHKGVKSQLCIQLAGCFWRFDDDGFFDGSRYSRFCCLFLRRLLFDSELYFGCRMKERGRSFGNLRKESILNDAQGKAIRRSEDKAIAVHLENQGFDPRIVLLKRQLLFEEALATTG